MIEHHAAGAVVPYTHPYPSSEGRFCTAQLVIGAFDVQCGAPASHKIREATDDQRHELTAYVCCDHFAAVMGPLGFRLCRRAKERPNG